MQIHTLSIVFATCIPVFAVGTLERNRKKDLAVNISWKLQPSVGISQISTSPVYQDKEVNF